MALPRRTLPAMAKVRQKLPSDHIPDVRGDMRQKLLETGLRDKIKPGNRIAVTAGSRGIGGLNELLSGITDAMRSRCVAPFVVSALASAGGATAEGQTELLPRGGVTEQ